ncbi:MAG: sulfatase-like hydrolase/transferase [Bryobacteraceae bacterium]
MRKKLGSLGLLAVLSCWAQTPVILISVDTLRADRLGARTPNINSFGDAGSVFTAAETQIPFTLPSHTTLMTSTYPFQSGVEENAGSVPPALTTLASVLKGRGYQTAAFIGSIFLERELGLDRGFDTYDSPFSFKAFSQLSGTMLFAGGPHNPYSVRERRPGALVIRAANQWLEGHDRWLAGHSGQPVFVFVHLFDMHRPWRQPSYDAQLEEVDRLLGGFEQTLKKDGWWDKALVVLTADHGEGLGDHGESDHGYFVYESTLHVPLIIHWPQGSAPLPARVEQPVGLIDVAPSILDFLKIPAPQGFKGRSFLDGSARPVYSESVYARDCFGWAALRSLRVGAYKYIDAPRPELYDLGKDPGELNSVISTHAGEASRLREQLRKLVTPAPAATPAGDPQRSKEVLESLGYLAPGPRGAASGAAADPKDKLPELLRYEDALNLLEARRYEAAVAVFRGILKADPRNLLARRDLGVTLIENESYQAARTELQQVAAAAPNDYVTRYELGIADESLSLFGEALDQFQAACRIAPEADQCKQAVERVKGRR